MKTLLLRFLFVLSSVSISPYLFAQPGALDSSFGINGRSNSTASNLYSQEFSALQQDGKIVVASGGYSSITNTDFIVSRYLTNGAPDVSFGSNGKTVIDFYSYVDDCHSIAIQPDGKIILAGTIYRQFFTPVYESIGYFGLVRFKTNGSVDTTFGINGKVITNFDTVYNDFYCNSVGIDSNGRIVAAGYGGIDPNQRGFAAVRYLANGKVDASFGSNGLALVKDGGWLYNMTIDAQQNIFLAGATSIEPINTSIKLVKLKSKGVIDSGFGTNGTALLNLGDYEDAAYSVKIQADGKIVMTGKSHFNSQNAMIFVTRHLTNGKIDSSFGINGVVLTDFGEVSCEAKSCVIQSDGKILVGGFSTKQVSPFSVKPNFAMARYLPVGVTDATFGNAGKVITEFASPSGANDILLQSDNKILMTGYADYPVILVRYLNDKAIEVNFQKSLATAEGNSGITSAKFKVILSRPATKDVLVDYSTKNLNALAGPDYIATSGTLRIKAGKTSGNIVVSIIGDNIREANERFALVLSNPINAVLGTLDSATCTIKNDDAMFALNSSSIENITRAAVSIYPNPANNILTVQGLSPAIKTQLSIVDIDGRILLTKTVVNAVYNWNIKSLPSGSYFLKISSENNSYVLPLIKQ